MATINPGLVPTINPGDLFDEFTTDSTLNIRWLTAGDPAYFEVLNRPIADTVLRQLIIAKALDDLNTSLGYQSIFPFVVPPQVSDGSSILDIPIRIFWDLHVSLPIRWINLRLARIDRLDGENGGSEGYVGTLRFIFTAQQFVGDTTSGVETAIFYADYEIGSDLTYQRVRIEPATASAVTGFNVISAGEQVTIDGEAVFRTLDTTVAANQTFFDLLAPGASVNEYEVVDSTGIGSGPDFSDSPLSHGTGILTSSAFNLITPVDADPITWIDSFNYPFDQDVLLESNDSSGVTIPSGIFREMDIVAPAGEEPTGDSSGAFFPVWISKIERDGSETTPTLIFYFSTHAVDPDNVGVDVEFATLILAADMVEGQIVNIVPNEHLWPSETASNWHQEFGRGHVVLSSKWGSTGGEVDDFFNNFPLLIGAISTATFDQSATRISAWGLSRVPKYTPTQGQAAALLGTSSERSTPLNPSADNRYVTELDEGLGDLVDLEVETGITANAAIERYGNASSRIHQCVKLIVDPEQASDSGDSDFYTNEVLPRLRVLFGRDPVFGDIWYNGNRFMQYNGDSWVG